MYLMKKMYLFLFINFIGSFVCAQCTSTTADILYNGIENYSLTNDVHTQEWELRNYTNCAVQDFSIEEFPEVFIQTSSGNWTQNNTPVTNIVVLPFSLGGTNQIGTAEVSFRFSPAATGTYRIYFRIKDQHNTTLNDICATAPGRCRLYTEITVGTPPNLPNLRVSSASAPSSSTAGATIPVSYTIQNNGLGSAGSSTSRIWYSEDPNINPYSSTLLTSRSTPTLNAGGITTNNLQVTIPNNAASGSQYICVQTDVHNILSETNESDNLRCEPITISNLVYHDLTTTNESVSPMTTTQGGTFRARCDAQYTGTGSVSSRVAVYLSSGSTLNSSSILVGTYNSMQLSSSSTSRSLSKLFSLSPTTPAGYYHVLFVSDYGNNVGEGVSGEQNNVRSVGGFRVNAVQDLTIINPSINKTFVMPGQFISMSCDLAYQGPHNILSSVVFHLSTTPSMAGFVQTLGTRNVVVNSNSSSYAGLSPTPTIPVVNNGTYYIIFEADPNNIFAETDESNNIVASIPFTISNTPPARDITVSNLQVNISGGGDFVCGGGFLGILADQNYVGPTNSNVTVTLRSVLSKDLVYDANDYILGSNFRSMSGGNSRQTSAGGNVPDNVPPGSYYILVKGDATNTVNETYENNNTQSYPQRIRICQNNWEHGNDYLAKENLCTKIGDPVNGATGEYLQYQEDLELYAYGQGFPWKRKYRSQSGYTGALGNGWTHNYDIHITTVPERWRVHYGDGHIETFVEYHDGSTYPLYWNMKDTIGRNVDSTYTLIKPNGTRYYFSKEGNITSIINEAGTSITFDYVGANLSRINLPGDRYYILSYQNGRISNVTDNAGRGVSYQYDVNGNMISYVNVRGGTFIYNYDNQNRLISSVDSKGITYVRNSYDVGGRVVQQQDASNSVSTFQYTQNSSGSYLTTSYTNPLGENNRYTFRDETHYMVSQRDPQGNWISPSPIGGSSLELASVIDQERNQYSLGYYMSRQRGRYETWKPTFIWNPLGEQIKIDYGVNNSPIALINYNGDTITITYDSLRNPLKVTFPNGAEANITYNSFGQVTSKTDPNGNVTSYTYAPNGDLIGIVTPSGSYQFQYDQVGRVVAVTDRNGNTSRTSYDSYGNILSITDAMGFTVSASYDANGNIDTLVDKNGAITVFEYDVMDRVIGMKNALGEQTQYTYDAIGQLTQVTYPNGGTESYVYNPMGWVTSKTNPLGTWTYTYNKVGDLLTVTDALNNTVSTTTYDRLRRPVTQQDALGNIRRMVYDRANRRVTSIDGNGHPTIYESDVIGQLIRVIDANGGQNNMTYDPSGNMLTLTDANGHAMTYNGYNHHHLPSSVSYAGGYTTSYQYDNEGHVLQKTDPNGISSALNYDNNYRVTGVNYSNGATYNFNYDNAGGLLAMSNSNGSTNFVLDVLGRTTSTTDPFGNTVEYGYNSIGNNTHIVYPSGDTVKMTYNRVGLQTGVQDWLGNSKQQIYDANGQLSQILNSNGTSTLLTRDALGRITAYDNFLGNGSRLYSDSIGYDAEGNITQLLSDNLLPLNAMAGTQSYSYGADDRTIQSPQGTYTHDASGARTGITGAMSATYVQGENDLVKQYTVNGQTTENTFNPLRQAISKTKNGVEHRYAYNNVQSDLYTSIQEFDNTNTALSSSIYTADGLGWMLDSTGNVSFPHYTYIGHTKALTNSIGDTTDVYAHDMFGKYYAHRGNSTQPHTFLGKYGIVQEGDNHYHIRARYYDAGTGRFISKDAAAMGTGNTQGVNRYVYSQNRALGAIDVNGYNSQEIKHCPVDGLHPVNKIYNLDKSYNSTVLEKNYGINEESLSFFQYDGRRGYLTLAENLVENNQDSYKYTVRNESSNNAFILYENWEDGFANGFYTNKIMVLPPGYQINEYTDFISTVEHGIYKTPGKPGIIWGRYEYTGPIRIRDNGFIRDKHIENFDYNDGGFVKKYSKIFNETYQVRHLYEFLDSVK